MSEPIPESPTNRSLPFAHVPLDTVAVPTLPAFLPSTPYKLVTLPPVTLSEPIPESPTNRSLLFAHVPLDTAAEPTPAAALPRMPYVLLT